MTSSASALVCSKFNGNQMCIVWHLTEVLDSGNVLIDRVYSLAIYCVNKTDENVFMGQGLLFVSSSIGVNLCI